MPNRLTSCSCVDFLRIRMSTSGAGASRSAPHLSRISGKAPERVSKNWDVVSGGGLRPPERARGEAAVPLPGGEGRRGGATTEARSDAVQRRAAAPGPRGARLRGQRAEPAAIGEGEPARGGVGIAAAADVAEG